MKRLSLLLLLLISFMNPLFADIGVEYKKEQQNWLVVLENNSGTVYEAMVISASSDYKAVSGQLSVEPGESFTLEIISVQDSDQSDEPVYIRLISGHEDNPGLITLGETEKRKEPVVNSDGFLLEYYYTPTCSSCREFLNREIPLLEEKLDRKINIQHINITESDGLVKMNSRLKALGSSEKKLPMLIVGDLVLAGDRDIKEELESVLIKFSRGIIDSESTAPVAETTEQLKLSIIPILLAGLLDGINPCAFSTLIFLLSWLTLAGRNRKQILLTGIFFSSAVFLTYYIVGLGAFTALRSSESVPVVASVLKYAMALLMLILSIIHILDYRKVKEGRSGEMTLQLSKERKKKIHSLIRGKARQAGLFAGSIALGILVTIYELGCTGQVYLPTLMYMVKIEKAFSSYLLLGIYNLGFIIPLLIVFIAAWKGIGSEKLTIWFQKNLAAVKLLSAAFFLLMALLLILF